MDLLLAIFIPDAMPGVGGPNTKQTLWLSAFTPFWGLDAEWNRIARGVTIAVGVGIPVFGLGVLISVGAFTHSAAFRELS